MYTSRDGKQALHLKMLLCRYLVRLSRYALIKPLKCNEKKNQFTCKKYKQHSSASNDTVGVDKKKVSHKPSTTILNA